MKILQINSYLNSGSTGKITEDIGNKIIEEGGESYIAYGRKANSSLSHPLKIGNKINQFLHLIETRIMDRHGLGSIHDTKNFIKKINRVNPDVVHLHNLHGYYINYKILFDYLKKKNIPVVWTLHDCWAFTGHCSYFTTIDCQKWQSRCFQCPLKTSYPASLFLDNSTSNFDLKKGLYSTYPNITFVVVSNWLKSLVEKSFLKEQKVVTIYNGVDKEKFRPTEGQFLQYQGLRKKEYILGVSNIWTERKGLHDFLELRKILNPELKIMLVGLNREQISNLPSNIQGIERTENQKELAELYSGALAFVNPSMMETFGMVTAEAMACGTPAIVYNATASPEIVHEGTGYVVEKGNIGQLHSAILSVLKNGKEFYSNTCISVVENKFNKDINYAAYLKIYEEALRAKFE